MALTEANINKVAKIFLIPPYQVSDQITLLNTATIPRFTTQVETDVVALIARWDTGIGTEQTQIHPNVRNFGAKINPNAARDQIRGELAALFDREDWATMNSGVEFDISR